MSVPPGLERHGDLSRLISHGDDTWEECPKIKEYTNAFVWDPSQGKLLLGYKKRGFGQGLFNGFGGKVEPGESPLEAAERELQEEAGIVSKLELCGILLFVLEGLGFAHYVYIYRSHTYEGTPIETDEMVPQWFALPSKYNTHGAAASSTLLPIPYDKMWEDDRLWIPLLLSNIFFVGRVDFKSVSEGGHPKHVMEKWWIGKGMATMISPSVASVSM